MQNILMKMLLLLAAVSISCSQKEKSCNSFKSIDLDSSIDNYKFKKLQTHENYLHIAHEELAEYSLDSIMNAFPVERMYLNIHNNLISAINVKIDSQVVPKGQLKKLLIMKYGEPLSNLQGTSVLAGTRWETDCMEIRLETDLPGLLDLTYISKKRIKEDQNKLDSSKIDLSDI